MRPTEAFVNRKDQDVGSAFVAQSVHYLSNDYLPKIERCLEPLTDEQIWWRPNPQSNSIGNLILHLCGNARQWILSGVGNRSDQRNRDSEFAQVEIIPRDELLKHLQGTLVEIESVLSSLDPETLLEPRTIQGCNVDVLEAIYHVTEHFSMHTGQIILMTKMMTGHDLRFYDFSSGAPTHRWPAPQK